MPTELKKKTIASLEKEVKEATGLVITSFKGLKTTEFNELRAKIRSPKSQYKVVKNSLTRLALKNAGLDKLAETLQGPSAVVIERGDALATIKTFFEFAKTHENLKITGGSLEGKMLSASELKSIASLPPKEMLYAQLLGTLQAPMVNLVSVLQAPIRDLVSVLGQAAKKQEKAS